VSWYVAGHLILGNYACMDLCGACRVTGMPTATVAELKTEDVLETMKNRTVPGMRWYVWTTNGSHYRPTSAPPLRHSATGRAAG
jgi:hypothetical protein